MINLLLTSLLTFNATTINLTDTAQTSEHLTSEVIQVPQDSQLLIETLYQYANKHGMDGICTHMHLEMLSLESIEDQELEHLPPGTLIFLGKSEANIQAIVLCLNDGQGSQISSQDGNTEFSLCQLAELDFSRFPYYAIYKTSDAPLIDKPCAENLNLAADRPYFLNETFNSYFVNDECFPFVISPLNEITLTSFKAWAESHQNELHSLMASQGAVLLRGFPVDCAEDFATIVKAVIGRNLIDYKGEGSRTRVAQGVYTSTEAPPEFKIPLHNELSCTNNPIDYICFYCDIAPNLGTGQTILARTEDVTIEMLKRPHIWDLFNGRNINYISRHPPEGNFFTRVNPTHKTWQKAFETSDKDEVPRICMEKGYDFKWLGEWVEVTRHVPAIRGPDQYFDHPYWFNQAHLYHANPRIRGGWTNHLLANLLYISPSTKQYDIEFEDGTPMTQQVIYEIYDILDEKTIKFNWEKGDVLLLDNRRALHGRAPYIGQRRILTAMVQ